MEVRLAPAWRWLLVVAGLSLAAAAWPVGSIAMVFAGGGHGSPFGDGWIEAVFGLAMLGIPLAIFALGIALIAATSRRRLRIAGLVALAFPLDLAIAAAAIWQMNQPDPPPGYPLVVQAPEPRTKRIVDAGGPMTESIACSTTGDECVITRTTQTPKGPVTTREVNRPTSPARP